MTTPAHVLVLDWGIGGAGALARLLAAYPHLSMVYWSDSGQTPYGRLAPEALAARLERVLEYAARAWGVTHALVACNAASTALHAVRASVPVAGVIEPAVAHLSALPRQTIGIIGGERTIDSGAYTRPLREAGHAVVGVATQPLSALIEAGEHVGDGARAQVAGLLRGLERVDTLALACTHYPAASALIASILPGVDLYDPLDAAMAWIASQWEPSWPMMSDSVATLDVVTTGDPAATTRAARLAFGVVWQDVRAVALE